MKVYHLGYWHSSSEYVDLGCFLCENKREAQKILDKEADGLGIISQEQRMREIKSIYGLASKKVVDFLLEKENKNE